MNTREREKQEEEQRRMNFLLRFDGFCHAYVGRRGGHKTGRGKQ